MQDTDHTDSSVKIGTRGSPLALAQAEEVRTRLLKAHQGLQEDQVKIIVLSTKGDRIVDRPLAEIGGKGLFTEEIEEALLKGAIDLAVHSSKDMPTKLPDGLELACYLQREDVRDAFISLKASSPLDLASGSVIGSASLRRQAQTLALRQDVTVQSFRGNVQSRLRKLEQGVVDATYLAMAGLNRLGLSGDERIHPLPTADFLPAVAQGAITLEIARDNEGARRLIEPLNHMETALCVSAERAMLTVLDGSCRTPIAGLARISDGMLTLQGQLLSPDGRLNYREKISGPMERAEELGQELGQRLRKIAGEEFFAMLAQGHQT